MQCWIVTSLPQYLETHPAWDVINNIYNQYMALVRMALQYKAEPQSLQALGKLVVVLPLFLAGGQLPCVPKLVNLG